MFRSLVGLRDWHSMSNALTTKLLSKLGENPELTTRLENTSSRTERYNQPS